MFLLSILQGQPGLLWGCREKVRRCSRWLLTGPPMAHLETEDTVRLEFLMQIRRLDGLFSFTPEHYILYLSGTVMTNEYKHANVLKDDWVRCKCWNPLKHTHTQVRNCVPYEKDKLQI